jgi:hypothetical protein
MSIHFKKLFNRRRPEAILLTEQPPGTAWQARKDVKISEDSRPAD